MDQGITPFTVATCSATCSTCSATQTQLREVGAAAKELREKILSCEKILRVFNGFLPEKPLDQHTHPTVPESQQPLDQPLFEAKAAAEEFLKGTKHNHYRRLYIAASQGDWETAKSFIKDDPSALTARITSESLTTLMVASRACQWKFVRKLLEDLPSDSLVPQDVYGRTALHYVAMGGSLKTAQALKGKNSALPRIPNSKGVFPLFVSFGNEKLVWYLLLITMHMHFSLPFTLPLSAYLLCVLFVLGYYDIISFLVRRYPQLAILKSCDMPICLLYFLSHALQSGQSNLRFWPKWTYKLIPVELAYVPPRSIFINMEDILRNAVDFPNMAAPEQPSSILTRGLQINCFCVLKALNRLLWKAIEQLAAPLKQVQQEKLKQAYVVKIVEHVCESATSMTYEQILEHFNRPFPVLNYAASRGNVEIISTCLRYFPDLIFIGKEYGHNRLNLLQEAIKHRQAKLFNFIKKMPTITQILYAGTEGEEGKTLNLAAELAPLPQLLSISGAAFQMQSEVQWFKEVEKLTNPDLRGAQQRHMKGKTAMQVFIEHHKDIAEKGEKWMKDTANSGLIVTTLIATVVMAAAFTVPGGNNDQGIPNFQHKPSFLIFVVSDALALFSSVTSLLMFLSILTASYAVEDFLFALPNRIIIGLGSLFFALATMMVAFGATLFIVLSEKWQWAYIPIILLASIPVTIFAWHQLPLFIRMIKSTYASRIFRS